MYLLENTGTCNLIERGPSYGEIDDSLFSDHIIDVVLGDFVRANGLQEGDFIVIYSDTKCGKYVSYSLLLPLFHPMLQTL